MWSSDGEGGDPSGRIHTMLVWLGFGALLVAAFVFMLGMTRTQWPVARAQVLSVDVKCAMTASGYTRRYAVAGRVFIACDQVEKFRADNPSRGWSASKVYTGQVRVTRDGHAVTVELGLRGWERVPQVGDIFEVIQNPDTPADVSVAERSLSEIGLGACIGGAGIFMLVVAFAWF